MEVSCRRRRSAAPPRPAQQGGPGGRRRRLGGHSGPHTANTSSATVTPSRNARNKLVATTPGEAPATALPLPLQVLPAYARRVRGRADGGQPAADSPCTIMETVTIEFEKAWAVTGAVRLPRRWYSKASSTPTTKIGTR